MIKQGLFILIVLLLLVTSCKKDTVSIVPERTFYDFPKNKLWAHRVNTAEEANIFLKQFAGIETDVFFINDQNGFQTGHDAPSGISLESFFDSIVNVRQYYYWIDFKNLSNENVQSSLSEIKRLIEVYQLEGRIIIESSNPDLLAFFKCDNIFTSYWIQ